MRRAPRSKAHGRWARAIVDYDRVREDREAIAASICAERGAVLVKPFDDAGIIAGQGTAGLEIAEDAARFGVTLDEVLAPCSGGGLVSGVALALKGCGRDGAGPQRRAGEFRRHEALAGSGQRASRRRAASCPSPMP